MCKIEELIQISAEGVDVKSERIIPCGKARNGKLCEWVKKQQGRYPPPPHISSEDEDEFESVVVEKNELKIDVPDDLSLPQEKTSPKPKHRPMHKASRTASVSSMQRPASTRRPIITQDTKKSSHSEPIRRRRPDVPHSMSSDRTSHRSDPLPYSPPSPTYARQPAPYNTQGPAIIQPARTRRPSVSTRPRPQSFAGEAGAPYWVQGMSAPGYPTPPQEQRGPPPAFSAYYSPSVHMNYPPPAPTSYKPPMPPMPHSGYIPQSGYNPSLYPVAPLYESQIPQRPPLSASHSRQMPPPVVIQARDDLSATERQQQRLTYRPAPHKLSQHQDDDDSEEESSEEESDEYESQDEERRIRADRALMPPPMLRRGQSQRPQSQSRTVPAIERLEGHGERRKAIVVPSVARRGSVSRLPHRQTHSEYDTPGSRIEVNRTGSMRRQIRSEYDTPQARVEVNNSKSNRRQSYQAYDKALAEELDQRYREARKIEAHEQQDRDEGRKAIRASDPPIRTRRNASTTGFSTTMPPAKKQPDGLRKMFALDREKRSLAQEANERSSTSKIISDDAPVKEVVVADSERDALALSDQTGPGNAADLSPDPGVSNLPLPLPPANSSREIAPPVESAPYTSNDIQHAQKKERWSSQRTPDGRLFYFNPTTGQSATKLPLDSHLKAPPVDTAPPNSNDHSHAEGEDDWIPKATPDGGVFYFNTTTGQSAMKLPLGSYLSIEAVSHDSTSTNQRSLPAQPTQRALEKNQDDELDMKRKQAFILMSEKVFANATTQAAQSSAKVSEISNLEEAPRIRVGDALEDAEPQGVPLANPGIPRLVHERAGYEPDSDNDSAGSNPENRRRGGRAPRRGVYDPRIGGMFAAHQQAMQEQQMTGSLIDVEPSDHAPVARPQIESPHMGFDGADSVVKEKDDTPVSQGAPERTLVKHDGPRSDVPYSHNASRIQNPSVASFDEPWSYTPRSPASATSTKPYTWSSHNNNNNNNNKPVVYGYIKTSHSTTSIGTSTPVDPITKPSSRPGSPAQTNPSGGLSGSISDDDMSSTGSADAPTEDDKEDVQASANAAKRARVMHAVGIENLHMGSNDWNVDDFASDEQTPSDHETQKSRQRKPDPSPIAKLDEGHAELETEPRRISLETLARTTSYTGSGKPILPFEERSQAQTPAANEFAADDFDDKNGRMDPSTTDITMDLPVTVQLQDHQADPIPRGDVDLVADFGLKTCESCERQGPKIWYCSLCCIDLCEECWSQQAPHRPGRVGPDGLPHMKEIAANAKRTEVEVRSGKIRGMKVVNLKEPGHESEVVRLKEEASDIAAGMKNPEMNLTASQISSTLYDADIEDPSHANSLPRALQADRFAFDVAGVLGLNRAFEEIPEYKPQTGAIDRMVTEFDGEAHQEEALESYNDLAVAPPPTQEVHWDLIYGKYGGYQFSDSSRPSSYANSVLSTASLASSATDLSKHTGYSPMQIARATKELIVVLQDDIDLAPLYKRAIADDSIGPEKLERNLKRLFRNYAEHLGKGAGDTLELLASQLVRAKARAVAQSIVQRYGSTNDAMHRKAKEERQNQEQDQSSDEEAAARPVDESVFEDLIIFREFLVGSEAFTLLHTQIRSFILPKSERPELIEVPVVRDADCKPLAPKVEASDINPVTVIIQPVSIRDWIARAKWTVNAALVATNCLERPLETGFTRLRWQCVSRTL